MARNSEKKLVGLNRMLLEQQQKGCDVLLYHY